MALKKVIYIYCELSLLGRKEEKEKEKKKKLVHYSPTLPPKVGQACLYECVLNHRLVYRLKG